MDRSFRLWRFAAALASGGVLAVVVALCTVSGVGRPSPDDLALVALFLGGGTILRMILPTLALYSALRWAVRRGRVSATGASVFGAAVLAAAGWLVLTDQAQEVFGPRIWNSPGPVAALSGLVFLPIMAFAFQRRSLR